MGWLAYTFFFAWSFKPAVWLLVWLGVMDYDGYHTIEFDHNCWLVGFVSVGWAGRMERVWSDMDAFDRAGVQAYERVFGEQNGRMDGRLCFHGAVDDGGWFWMSTSSFGAFNEWMDG